MIKKKQNEIWKNQHSTFSEQASILVETKWISIPLSKYFYRIKSFLGKYNIKVVGSSRDATLKRRLASQKDPLTEEEKSGIYKINCNDWEMFYIGQTKRLITTRFQEHIKEVDKGERRGTNMVRTSVAMYVIEVDHSVTRQHMELVQ